METFNNLEFELIPEGYVSYSWYFLILNINEGVHIQMIIQPKELSTRIYMEIV